MWRTKRHVPDGELLLLDEDGALSARRRSAVSRHVAACPRCARRRAELAAMLAEATVACRETPIRAAAPLPAARAGLRAAMEARPPSRGGLAGRPRAGWLLTRWSPAGWPLTGWSPAGWLLTGWSPAGWPFRLAATAVAVVAVVAALSWPTADGPGVPADRHGTPADPQTALADRQAGAAPPDAAIPGPSRGGGRASTGLERPRHDLTPGRVLPVGVDEVCSAGITGLPPVAAQVPRQVFEAYGVDYRRAADYELDFLITPELGGAPDPRNLWPQPYRAGVWNAYVKDELERELQALVCRGALDLATAQQELADDWIAAYKRRFNTDRPLRDYGRFPLGPADVEAIRSEFAERRLLPAGGPIASARTGAAPPVYATAAGRRFAAAGG